MKVLPEIACWSNTKLEGHTAGSGDTPKRHLTQSRRRQPLTKTYQSGESSWQIVSCSQAMTGSPDSILSLTWPMAPCVHMR